MTNQKLAGRPTQVLMRESQGRARLRRSVLHAVTGLSAFAPILALANPSGGQVAAGSATIGSAGANGLVITQNSQNAVINWQQFSIGSNQYVQFAQPNSSSVVLNRVIGNNPSSIFGDIKANGQVFLINPNGILFGRGATLDVSSLTASTLDISNSNFMSGNYVFSKAAGAADASVVNRGNIRTENGGYVVLAGDYVENDGTINAQSGRVVLAAGGAATLTLQNNALISFVVDSATLARLAGVTNTGEITAEGGAVLMTADVANALTATAVNNSGFITAHSVQDHGGEIVLVSEGGDIENSGTLDASAVGDGVAGGTVIVHARGGDTALTVNSQIDVTGQGGGQGGFVDVSGHNLTLKGAINVGKGGNLLLDPSTITIESSGTALAANCSGCEGGVIHTNFIQHELNAGVDLTIVASNQIVIGSGNHGAGPATNITATTGTGKLSLKIGTASFNTIGGSLHRITSSIFSNQGLLNETFTPSPGGAINIAGLAIHIKGGFVASASHGLVILGNVKAAGGITISGSRITTGSLSASAGNVLITGTKSQAGSTSISQTGLIKGKSVTVTENFGFIASYGGTITLGSVDATAGNISIAAVMTAQTENMSINAGILTASKAVKITEEGFGGHVNVGNITANGSSSHIGVSVVTHTTGFSAGNVAAGKILATGGGVLFSAANSGISARGGDVNLGSVTAKYINIKAKGERGGDVSTGKLHATGLATGSGVRVTADASGGASSSGGKIRVSGTITADHGSVYLSAQGGTDSGGNINVQGAILAAGSVTVLAVGFGSCCDGNVSISGAVTGKFIDIAARNTDASNHSGGGKISITGNVTATGTALVTSPSQGVNIHAGSSGAQNGAPSITVHGKITASHGAVNLIAWGNGSRGRAINVGSAGSSWVAGVIKGQEVNIIVNGAGSGGSIDVGGITTLGAGIGGDASLFAQGNGSGHITVHGNMQINGTEARIVNDGVSINVTGSITVSGANGRASIEDFNSGGGIGSANISVAGNITAPGRVFVDAVGHGGSPVSVSVSVGTVTGSNLSFQVDNQSGGNASLNATKLTAPHINVSAQGNAGSGHGGHINIASIDAVSNSGSASVDINAYGKADTVTLTTVAVSGHAVDRICSGECGAGLHPLGARFEVFTHGGSSDAITVNGNITVTALTTIGSSHAGGDAVITIGGFAGSSFVAPVSNLKAVINGSITVNAARDVHMAIHGGASGALSVKAGRNIDDSVPSSEATFSQTAQPNLVMNVGAVALQAGGNVMLSNASLTVGNGAVPGVSGDHAVTQFFGLGSIAPNAALIAGGNIDIGTFTGTGVNYLLIEDQGTLTLGTFTLASNAVVQLTTLNTTDTLGVGNGAGTIQYTAAEISMFSAFNVVIGGSALTGTLTVGTVNLGTQGITLAGNGAITGSGLLAAGSLTLLAGTGTVTLTTAVATTDIVSGAHVNVNDSAFAGSGALSISSVGVGSVSYDFGVAGTLATAVKITGALTLKSQGALNLSSAAVHAGQGVTLNASGSLDLTGASLQAGGAVALTAGKQILLGKTVVTAGGAFSADAHGSISDSGLGGSIKAAGATFKTATGNVVLAGETLNTGATNLVFSAAGNVSLNSATIHAGSMSVAAASNVQMTNATINAAKFTVVAGGSLDLTGASLQAGGAVALTAGKQILLGKTVVTAGGAFSADAHGSISDSGLGGSIKAAGATFKTATGNVVLAGETLNTGATNLVFSAAGNVSLNSATIHAGSMSVAAASNVQMTNATINAAKFTVVAGGSLDLTGASLQAGGAVALTAGKQILLGKTVVTAGGAFSADAHGSISDSGLGGSIKAAGATFKTATGNVVLAGETLNTGATNLVFSAAGNVSLNSATIHAGSMSVAAASNVQMTNATINAAKFTVVAGGSIDLSSDTVTVTGLTQLTAGFVSATQPLAAKDIVLSGITLTTGIFEASAGGTIHNGGGLGTITAGAIAVIADKNINLSSTAISIGTGTLNGVLGDSAMLQGLAAVGIVPASSNPNGVFEAGGTLTLGGLTINGSYLYLQANSVSILGKVTAAAGLLVQMQPGDPAAGIGVEDQPGTTQAFNLSNQGFFALFAGNTIVVGGDPESGDVFIGTQGNITLAPGTNLIFDTSGTVTGLSNLLGSGLIGVLESLAGVANTNVVTAGEIDPTADSTGPGDQTDKKHLGLNNGNNGANGPNGSVDQDTDTSSVCH